MVFLYNKEVPDTVILLLKSIVAIILSILLGGLIKNKLAVSLVLIKPSSSLLLINIPQLLPKIGIVLVLFNVYILLLDKLILVIKLFVLLPNICV